MFTWQRPEQGSQLSAAELAHDLCAGFLSNTFPDAIKYSVTRLENLKNLVYHIGIFVVKHIGCA
jgi:hypothetical protein